MASQARPQATFLGHPVGLYVLFFTEMWERFSYYGMRALLMLYMVNYFLMDQKEASGVYKWYTSLVYLTPILGGYLADRYLGNKWAVVIGATLMAVGHFLMAFEQKTIFYAALVFLIFGNGFFKPNMSTQVGRLYPRNDGRRDGAYTIFYMGINLGAFLSPLVCGWLAENTVGGYHTGFTMAGVGMVIGLLTYLGGLPWVVELDEGKAATPGEEAAATQAAVVEPGQSRPLSETEAERIPSALPTVNRLAPAFLTLLGVAALVVASPALLAAGLPRLGERGVPVGWAKDLPQLAGRLGIAFDTAISLVIAAVCFLISAWIIRQTRQGVRDRVLAIYALGLFVVFFWAAFEQAGNALNLWADKTTDRYLTTDAPPPPLFPEVKEEPAPAAGAEKREVGGGPLTLEHWLGLFKPLPRPAAQTKDQTLGEQWQSFWNPVPTAWFQSINALAIFLLAPLFAWLWTSLARRGMNPSIPTKMAIGVLLMGLSFAVMIGAAKQEDKPSSTRLLNEHLPEAIKLTETNQLAARQESGHLEPFHAGRLTYDKTTHTLHLTGVLPDTERDRLVRETAPASFVAQVNELKGLKEEDGAKGRDDSVELNPVPPGFDMRYAGLKKSEIRYDAVTHRLHANRPLADKDVKALLTAAGDPQFRDTLNELMVQSARFRVSAWWLFWFYLLATLGELCLSPVGLSMVSKLAPAKFATMLMGLWLLTSFFGNFVAGAFGEIWGTVPPGPYFTIFLVALGGASLVLFVLVRKIVAMMHGVN